MSRRAASSPTAMIVPRTAPIGGGTVCTSGSELLVAETLCVDAGWRGVLHSRGAAREVSAADLLFARERPKGRFTAVPARCGGSIALVPADEAFEAVFVGNPPCTPALCFGEKRLCSYEPPDSLALNAFSWEPYRALKYAGDTLISLWDIGGTVIAAGGVLASARVGLYRLSFRTVVLP